MEEHVIIQNLKQTIFKLLNHRNEKIGEHLITTQSFTLKLECMPRFPSQQFITVKWFGTYKNAK